MDRLKQIETFVAVATKGSLTAAAQGEGVAPAIIGRRMDALEARLGVKLLLRTTRRISLTHEGSAFLEDCQRLITDFNNAEASVSAGGVKASGHLRITAPAGFGRRHVAPLVPSFLDQHPDVSLSLNLSDRVVDLVEEGYDMAVRIGRLASSSLIGRQLSSTRMVLCASPGYLAAHGAPRHPRDLADHAVISYSLFSMGEQWEFEGPDGPVSVKVEPRMRTNSGDTCRQAALHDSGIVLQPSFLVGDDLRSGGLVELMPEYRSIELGIYAVYASRQHVSPKVRLLIDHLQRALAARRW